MPSSIALLICTAFVLFMLRLDHKQSSEVSTAFWVPTIWFLVLSSKPVAIWFQSTGAIIEEGNPIDRQFLMVMLLLGLIILAKRKFDWVNIIRGNVWFPVLLGYMLVSCLWADAPFISFKRWTRELIAVVMMFVIISEPQPWKALESLLRRTVYILIPFSYILIHYFPEYGRIYVHHSGDLMWVGASIHKNTLTQLCVAAIFFLVWSFIRRLHGYLSSVASLQTFLEIFIIILALMIMGGPNHSLTYSATATGAGIIGLTFMAALLWYQKRGALPATTTLTFLILFLIGYGTITPMLGKLSLIDVSSVMGREEHLTGRSDVWKALVPVAMSRPILGHGFEGFWTTSAREAFDISGAHNGFLDILLNLGFVGLGLYTLYVISIAREAHRVMERHFDWGVFLICSLVIALLSNITETNMVSFNSREMALILCLNFAFSARKSHTI